VYFPQFSLLWASGQVFGFAHPPSSASSFQKHCQYSVVNADCGSHECHA